MKNKIVVCGLFLIFGVYLFTSLFKDSYANIEEDQIKMDLYDNVNKEILLDDMENFIDLVDDYIFTNSSFNLSNVLNENYDFLTNFVLSFVSDNQEYFEIKYLDFIFDNGLIYVDEDGREYTSNRYIDVNTFYDITYKIFGVGYYYIMDENLLLDENSILLVENGLNDFDMKIDEITNIYSGNDYYDVYVKYIDNELEYIYRFDIVDGNRLVINNLSVGE